MYTTLSVGFSLRQQKGSWNHNQVGASYWKGTWLSFCFHHGGWRFLGWHSNSLI